MLPEPIENLSEKLQAFPGIGKRSSQKLALDLLEMEDQKYADLIDSFESVKKEVVLCKRCGFFSQKGREGGLCDICSDNQRNDTQLCIVEKPTDVLTIEKSQIFRGKYHVVNKLISPLDNVFAEHTTISQLVARLLEITKNTSGLELIVFFKAGFAGEATIAYIRDVLSEKKILQKIKITKLAQGLPLYYNPDTLDQATMVQALEDRRLI